MKISIFVHSLCGGGAEHVAALWAQGFFYQGHEVSVIVYAGNEVVYQLPNEVEFYEVKVSNKGKLNGYLCKLRSLRHVIKEIKPDVLITVMHPCGLYAYLATLGLGIPIINTEHNAFERPEGAKWSYFELFQKYYVNRLFRCVTVLTKADKVFIGRRLKNVYPLPNPLPFQPMKEVPTKANIVLAMGRLDAWYVKGFDVLIKSWSNVWKSHQDWKLQILGSGSPKSLSLLKQMCEENGVLPGVELCGYQSNPEPYFQKASIFVLSSRCDGFGMVLTEAMAKGCACIACDYHGRQREIIRNEKDGLICEPDDPQSLTVAIEDLIISTDKRCAIQKHGLLRANDYTLDNIMNQWNVIMKSVKL